MERACKLQRQRQSTELDTQEGASKARPDVTDVSVDTAASHLWGGVAEVARNTLRHWPGAPLLCCAGLLLAVKGLCFIAGDGCKGCMAHMKFICSANFLHRGGSLLCLLI